MAEKGAVKKAIEEILKKEGCMDKEELAEKVAEKLGIDPEKDKTKFRAIKAVITKLVRKNKLKKKGNEVCLK